MKKILALASVCAALGALPARAERVVREISWSALKAEGRLANGDLVKGAAGAPDRLRVTHASGGPGASELFQLAAPGVTSPRYALQGEVAGEEIEGTAYLEMWSVFRGGARYFSRTLAPSGPMGSLGGTFAARPFVLPFTAEPGMVLEKLVVSVVFPGRGAVVLGPLRLVELGPGEEGGAPGAWLSPRGIGKAGGIAGGVLGLLGAAAGVLAGIGRARTLVLGLLWAIAGVGVAALAGAGLAIASDQPQELVSLLVLLGAVGAGVPAALLGRVKRSFEEREFRRMQALDSR